MLLDIAMQQYVEDFKMTSPVSYPLSSHLITYSTHPPFPLQVYWSPVSQALQVCPLPLALAASSLPASSPPT